MSGALKSVFGGNGGIFGAVLGVASMFFPPLAVAGSLSNLLTSAIGQAVKMAASTLMKEFAMPKFLGPIINQIVDGVVSGLNSKNPTNPEVDQHVSEQHGQALTDATNELSRQLIDGVVKKVNEKTKGATSSGKTGTVSAGSWLEAIAIALGEAQGNKAASLVKLADELKDLSAKQTNGSQDEKTKNAQQFTIKSQQLQAVGQEMSILQNAATNAIKSIGEALSQAARKG
jgi:hypothetical protein